MRLHDETARYALRLRQAFALFLCALAIARFFDVPAHAGELTVSSPEPGIIEITARDANIGHVFTTLGELVGFEVSGVPGEACTSFSGKITGQLFDVLGRFDRNCSFIIYESFGSDGESSVTKVRFLNGTSRSRSELTISPDTAKYSDESKAADDSEHGSAEAHLEPANEGFLGNYKRRLERQERETVEKLWNWSSSEEPKTLCGNSRRDC